MEFHIEHLVDHLELTSPGFQFLALGIAVVGLWLPWRAISTLLAAAVLGVAVLAGHMTLEAILALWALAIQIDLYRRNSHRPIISTALVISIALVAVGLGVHAFPGFSQWLVAGDVQLGRTGAPFSIWYYLDKPFVGILLLLMLWDSMRHAAARMPIAKTLATIALGIVCVYSISYAMGYTRFDPKASILFWPWAIKNLLFVCVAEEVFFRGFLQTHVSRIIPHRHGSSIALVVVAVFFGIAHIGGGISYVLLATVAGLVYGFAYQQTGRIEFAILTHFVLNCGHFLFFSYPYARI